MMHLDTVMTMIDRATFVQYPYLERQPRSWTLTSNGDDRTISVTRNHDLWETVAEALGEDKVTVLSTDEDIRAAEREQWDDGTNYLAVAPGPCSAAARSWSAPAAAACPSSTGPGAPAAWRP
jgi:arginine deiminase